MEPSVLIRWASPLLLLIGCNQQPAESPRDRIRAILSDPGQLEILALDPYGIDYDLVTLGLVEHLRGYEILHRAHIEDGELEAEIVRLVLLGIDQEVGERALCFNPRHGLRTEFGEASQEILICYECQLVLLYVDGNFVGNAPTGDSPAERMNAIWEAQGCPIHE